jgi:predicted amidophosphoribosyltransferase
MVGDFTQVAGWMCFGRLDRLWYDVPTHTVAWRFTDESNDPWTRRINAFKDNHAPALNGAARVLQVAIPALLSHYRWKPEMTAVTAALSSGDTRSVPIKALPRVGRYVSTRLGMRWLPDILSKQAHRRLHDIRKAEDRDSEVDNANYVCTPINGTVRRILVLDDIVTRGTTFDNIRKAIRSTNREVAVFPIALGKSEKKSYAASLGRTISNEHIPPDWQRLWDTR